MLRSVVGSFVSEGAPVGSATLSAILPMRLSSASVRATLSELADLGLVEQPHTSAGRVPTERGLRVFIDTLLGPGRVPEYDRRTIAHSVDEADGDTVVHVASQLLSDCTRQLGFVVAPRIDRVVLCHVSLARLSSERVVVVLVSQAGAAYRRVLDEAVGLEQPELDRVATLLNERVAGRTLREVRDALGREARELRSRADRMLARALDLGIRALSADTNLEADLVIETRRALLDQPEFRDPERIRELFEAVETKERLLEVLDQMLGGSGVYVALGDEVGDPALRRCALVASHYGDELAPLGVLGVIGPSRMNYAHVIPVVDYLSRVVTEKLSA